MHLQHFLSWNKVNIKHSCKSQLYNDELDDDDQDDGYKKLRIRIIKCSFHLNIHLAFRFHILVSQFPFDNLFWILNLENISICVDKYFGIWLLIKHLLNFLDTLSQKLNIFIMLVQTQRYITCKLYHIMQIFVFFNG